MKTFMPRTRRMVFCRVGIFAAVTVLASLACVYPDYPAPTVPASTPVIPGDWICYTNLTYGFRICYPPDATFTTGSAAHSRIDLPFAGGTNLIEKWMDVDSREGLADCVSPETEGYADGVIDTEAHTINGLAFFVQSAGQGAAGNYYNWTGYSTERDGVCVSLTGVLHSTNALVYPTPPPEFDLAAENAVFAQIADTFVWLEEAPPVTPAMTPVPDDWLCYQNELYAFEVCYPPDATLSGETADHVRINLTIAPGTNLIEKWMDVDGRTTPPDCESPQASGYDPGAIDSHTRMIAGLDFLVQAASEGAAGSIYQWTGYSTERDGVCAGLTGILHSGNLDNYSTPPAAFDKAVEHAVMEQIANTFRWLDAATPTPAADETPTATFTANTNCRRGAGLDHEVVTYLREGATALIVGHNEDSSWWLVQVPGSALRCWVWGEFVKPHGDLAGVPFVESPVLGCWVQDRKTGKNKCAVPCPDGAIPGGVCEP
jgi:hypothetical protein